MFNKKTIEKILKELEGEDIVIKTDIPTGKGLNGTDYTEIKIIIKCDREQTSYTTFSIEEITEDYLKIEFTDYIKVSRTVSYPAEAARLENKYPPTERMLYVPLERVTSIGTVARKKWITN